MLKRVQVWSAGVVLLIASQIVFAVSLSGRCDSRDIDDSQLLSNPIRLLSWNVQKAQSSGLKPLLQTLSTQQDLILIQEAVLSEDLLAGFKSHHWDFAPGYQTASGPSGVLTASRIKAREHCQFSALEPWLRTPKAAAISRFDLLDSDEQMLVVNMHSINFSFGIEDFSRQLQQVADYIDAHSGPIIFAGDFNTWSERRLLLLQAMAAQHSLQALDFPQDDRTRFFGQALDHIFIRGLKARSSEILKTDTSDHNILLVELERL